MNQGYPLIGPCFFSCTQGFAFYADDSPQGGTTSTSEKLKYCLRSPTDHLETLSHTFLLSYSFFLLSSSLYFLFLPLLLSHACSDLFEALSELIILTASRCLHGVEIRSVLTESVAQLYTDLDGGFTHAAWILPPWIPLPSFR